MSREIPSSLTEWDFDIPTDNRFHDPFKWQGQEGKREDRPDAGSAEPPSTVLPPTREAA